VFLDLSEQQLTGGSSGGFAGIWDGRILGHSLHAFITISEINTIPLAQVAIKTQQAKTVFVVMSLSKL
jgi:hypothetical protein